MISVCILAKNEEKNIYDCLKSVQDVCDEIIVVNNGSEDRTKEICMKFGCTVIDSPNTIIDEGRNLYLEAAKEDWILILDADERLGKIDIENFKQFLSTLDKNVYGVNLNTYQYTGNGRWSNLRLIRLIRNNVGIEYQKTPIHADIETSIIESGGKIVDYDASVHHIDILRTNRTKNKRNRYKENLINILDKETVTNEKARGYLHCFLGLEYSAVLDFNKARKEYLYVIDNLKQCADFAKVFLCQNYLLEKKYDEAEKIVDTILIENVAGISDQVAYIKTEILRFNNKYSEAISLVENEIAKNPTKAHLYVNLSILYKNIDIEKTIKYIEYASELNDYLKKDIIYIDGEMPNIFFQQNCVLNTESSLKEIMQHYYKNNGNIEKYDEWAYSSNKE